MLNTSLINLNEPEANDTIESEQQLGTIPRIRAQTANKASRTLHNSEG